MIVDYQSKKNKWEFWPRVNEKREKAGWDISRRIVRKNSRLMCCVRELFENTYGRLTMSISSSRSSFQLFIKNAINAFKFHKVVAIITGVMLLFLGRMSVGEILAAYLILSMGPNRLIQFVLLKSSYLAAKSGYWYLSWAREESQSLQVMRSFGTLHSNQL